LLLLLLPLFLLVAIAVKWDSPGPVFYSAPRAGRRGRIFRCFKFRTMVAGADGSKDQLRAANEREGPCFKLSQDPRVTPLGRILRRYSVDELPQLWNVLRGEMSLVGPRPHPLDDIRRYQADHFQRLEVTPGVTGLWQVTARRDPSFQRAFALDLQYIEQQSLWLDLRILWRTAREVVSGGGV
jgi:lipopolysaccharide/colanic/teichoic acid biosynthesis glycosyltransferase